MKFAQQPAGRARCTWVAIFAAAGIGCAVSQAAVAASPEVIVLTQVPCQFVESEGGIERGYASRSKKDCEAINAKTGEQRVASAKPLVLAPGKYIFRVSNKNVPYELGFWLRGASALGRVTLPSTSGGGLHPGTSKDYEIDLVAGEYVYSCPLNPTPDYVLHVR